MPNIFSEMEGLKRRRALLDQLRQQSMEAPIVGHTGLGQALAKLGTAYITGKGHKEFDEQQGQLDARYQQGLGSEVEAFLKKSQGQGGETLNDAQAGALMNQNQDPGPLAEPIPADPMAAVTSAMASRYPEMQSIGKTALPFMMPKPKDETPFTLPKGARRYSSGGKELAHNADDDKWSEPYHIPGTEPSDRYIKHLVTGQIKRINDGPNVKVSATANSSGSKAGDKFDEAFGTAEGKALSEGLQARPGRIEGIAAAQGGLAMLDEGIYTGAAANWKKLGAKGLAELKLNDGEKAARTERFLAHVGDIVIPRLKDFGGNDTVEEMRYLQKVLAGDITMEEPALRKILEQADQKLRQRIAETDGGVERWHKAGKSGVPTVPSLMKVPEPYGGKKGAVPAPAGSPAPAANWDAEKLKRYEAWKAQQGTK